MIADSSCALSLCFVLYCGTLVFAEATVCILSHHTDTHSCTCVLAIDISMVLAKTQIVYATG